MTEEYEYYEENLAHEAQKESEKRFHRMPIICQKCRWLDWYHFEDCTHNTWPMHAHTTSEQCTLFAFDFYIPGPRWLRLLAWDVQYRLWKWKTRHLTN